MRLSKFAFLALILANTSKIASMEATKPQIQMNRLGMAIFYEFRSRKTRTAVQRNNNGQKYLVHINISGFSLNKTCTYTITALFSK